MTPPAVPSARLGVLAGFLLTLSLGSLPCHARPGCGADHHTLTGHVHAPLVEQRYVTTPSSTVRDAHPDRSLQSSVFMPMEQAHILGFTAPLRIHVEWGVVDAVETAAQCSAPGQTISVSGTPFTCSTDDVLVPDMLKYYQLQLRVSWAMDYVMSLLFVKPVQDAVVVSPSVKSEFPAVADRYTSTDLVIVMTARPAADPNIAGFAACIQRDQHGRCTVGWFNWVPRHIRVSMANAKSVIAAERETAVHEMVHILGGMRPSEAFVDDSGVPIMATGLAAGDGVVYDIDGGRGGAPASVSLHYGKPTTWIITPRVRALAREHFGCPTLKGLPLEDVPLVGGAGSHWEARLLGPELMSYGSASGEVFLSDATLAFLEDTEQYRANYTRAGRLVAPSPTSSDCSASASTGFVDFFFGNSMEEENRPEFRVDRAPGALRWGRGQGCAFVIGSAVNWASTYQCREDQLPGCTADNRMAALCSVRHSWHVLGRDASFGDITTSAATLINTECTDPSRCSIAPMFQYFTTESGDTLYRTGGYSQAMDFAPVQLGYWNCQDAEAQVADAMFSPDGAATTANLTALGAGDAVSDSGLFGGQCRCKECRCMLSSLRSVTSTAFNPSFPRYGLCYRTNCYKADYLQVAVRASLENKLNWYKCPAGGGRLYIPGFSGALHCPDATQFCTQEQITGVRKAEVQAWQLWVLLSVIVGVPFILLCLCFCPCIREPVVSRLKRCCGVTLLARKRTIWVEDPLSPLRGTLSSDPGTPVIHSPRKGAIVVGGGANTPRGGNDAAAAAAANDEHQQQDLVLVARSRVRMTRPPRCPGTIMVVGNVLVLLIASSVAIMVVSYMASGKLTIQSAPVVVLDMVLMVFGLAGVVGARKRARGLSCVVVSYLYGGAALVLVWVLLAFSMFGTEEAVHSTVDSNWDFFEDALQGRYDVDASRDAQVAEASDFLLENIAVVWTVMGVVVLGLGLGVLGAAKIIRSHNIATISFAVLNNVLACLGVLLVAFGVLMATTSTLGTIANLEPVVGPVIVASIATGAVLTAMSLFGLWAAFRVEKGPLLLYAVTVFTGFVFALIGASMAFRAAKNAADAVASLSEDDLSSLNFQRTPEQLESDVRAFYSGVGIACVSLAISWLMVLMSLIVFGRVVGLWLYADMSEAHAEKRRCRARGEATADDHSRAERMLAQVMPATPVYSRLEFQDNGDHTSPAPVTPLGLRTLHDGDGGGGGVGGAPRDDGGYNDGGYDEDEYADDGGGGGGGSPRRVRFGHVTQIG